MKTKHFTLLLIAVAVSIQSLAATKIGDLYYNLDSNNKTAEVVSNPDKYTGDVIIPESVSYNDVNYSVTSIGGSAFRTCSGLTSVMIPNSVTSIKYAAFDECTGLASVIIGNSVTSISESAFSYCTSLVSVTIPNSVTSIGVRAFQNCKGLASVIIGNSVTSIGSYAFYYCSNLNVVYIGNSVISIGEKAFTNCTQLYKIIMLPNSVPSGINNAFSNLSGRITYVGNTNYQSGYSVLGTQRVYSSLNSYFTVDGIVYALVNPSQRTCAIIDCDYSGGTTDFSIGNSVVYRNVTLSVESINTHAFRNNQKMTKLTIDYNHALPSYMATGCANLTNVVIHNLSSIGESAFADCSSIDTLIIASKGSIDSYAFRNCSKNADAYYNINNSGDISVYAFANCDKLHNVIIGDSVKNIGGNAFYQCYGIANADIANNGSIGSSAFRYCSTQDEATYHIHNRGSISDYAFANCTAITKVEIDTTVTIIGQYAFQKCTGLEDVTIQNKGNIGLKAFEGSSTKYSATYIISNVGQIGESAFANCSKLHKVRLGNQVSSINQSAFKNCVLMDSIIMPNSITTLRDSAFYNCTKLVFAKLSINIYTIGKATFGYCASLPELFIPKSVNSIDNSTFQRCSSLSVVSFEDDSDPLSLGRNAANQGLFYDCPLDSVYIGRGLTYPQTPSDGYSPFYRSSSLRSIVISNFPYKVENYEFYGCTNLYSVFIGNGVLIIGNYAFSGCSSIDYFSFGSQVQSIGAEAFSDCVSMTRLYSYCQVPPTCGASALEDIDKWNCTLYIPEGTISAYTEADQWRDFFFVEENEEGGDGTKFTISVDFDSSKGNVTGAGVYDRGADAVLIATPAEGCIFVEWEDGSTDPERHISVFKSATYTATFSAPKYDLYNGADAVVSGISSPNSIEMDRVSYPNAIAYSYYTTININLQDNVCGLNNDGDWYADCLVLTDAQPFYAPHDVEAKHLSYVRTFNDVEWQALYVPFDMNYSDFSSLAKIAYLNNVHQYDDDDNGVVDRTVIEFISVVNDNIEANWPYIVKPNSTGEITFNVDNTTLHATENNEVECQSVFTRFNVYGTYQNTTVANKYIIEEGGFVHSESSQDVSPFRLYLIVSNKYASSPQPAPKRISFMIDGKEEPAPTNVEVLYENESTGDVYDILGRPVSRPSNGIYIRNGEKFFIK